MAISVRTGTRGKGRFIWAGTRPLDYQPHLRPDRDPVIVPTGPCDPQDSVTCRRRKALVFGELGRGGTLEPLHTIIVHNVKRLPGFRGHVHTNLSRQRSRFKARVPVPRRVPCSIKPHLSRMRRVYFRQRGFCHFKSVILFLLQDYV